MWLYIVRVDLGLIPDAREVGRWTEGSIGDGRSDRWRVKFALFTLALVSGLTKVVGWGVVDRVVVKELVVHVDVVHLVNVIRNGLGSSAERESGKGS